MTLVGSIELTPLTDGVGILGELDELYPGVAGDAWTPYRELYPTLFRGTEWRVPCTCYLVRSGRRVVLVDTGIGPPGIWGWEPEWEGGLFRGLEQLGVEPAEVDVVLVTHIHVDHVGWNTDKVGKVRFPRARYLLHRDALACAVERGDRPHILRCVLSIFERGLVDQLAGETELAPGVVAVPLPGHDPGHVGVRIRSDGAEAVLIADAAVHPALLDEPDWPYTSDHDHEACLATRRALLEEIVDRDVLVVCGHYPRSGIGRVTRRDGRVVWAEAA